MFRGGNQSQSGTKKESEKKKMGYIIIDTDGREIAFCDEDAEAAEILCECVGGDAIIPADEYEDPDEI